MSLRFIPRTFLLLFFILCLGAHSAFAQQTRVGLANYDIVSGENVDYLKKAVREALSASLKEKGSVTLVEINQTEE